MDLVRVTCLPLVVALVLALGLGVVGILNLDHLVQDLLNNNIGGGFALFVVDLELFSDLKLVVLKVKEAVFQLLLDCSCFALTKLSDAFNASLSQERVLKRLVLQVLRVLLVLLSLLVELDTVLSPISDGEMDLLGPGNQELPLVLVLSEPQKDMWVGGSELEDKLVDSFHELVVYLVV